MTDRPEVKMVRMALVPAIATCVISFVAGYVFGGAGAAWSAALGIAIVYANFAANGYSLAWASTISVVLVQAVALGGFVLRMAVVIGIMFALNRLDWFSPLAFGLAVVPSTMLLLGFEARLVIRGIGTTLQIPADAAAVRAGVALAAREAN